MKEIKNMKNLSKRGGVLYKNKKSDVTGHLGDLGSTANVKIPQYLREKSHFLLKIKQKKVMKILNFGSK